MAARLTAEVKAAKVLTELLNTLSFDTGAFVVYLARTPLIVKERILDILVEFVDYEADVWDNQTERPMPMGSEDYYRNCARMRDAFKPYR